MTEEQSRWRRDLCRPIATCLPQEPPSGAGGGLSYCLSLFRVHCLEYTAWSSLLGVTLQVLSLRETLSSLRCCLRALHAYVVPLGRALVEALLPITSGSPMKCVAQSPAVWWLTCHDRYSPVVAWLPHAPPKCAQLMVECTSISVGNPLTIRRRSAVDLL